VAGYELVTTTTKRTNGSKPAAHLVAQKVNGIVTARCGAKFYPDAYRPADETHEPCRRCVGHAGLGGINRKAFVRNSYDGQV